MVFSKFARIILDRCFIKQPRLRRAVTKFIEGEKPTTIQLFGSSFLINPSREHGYLRAARRSQDTSLFRDEAGVMVSLALILTPGDTFVDVGANVGFFVVTLARAQRFMKNLRFYAFEPNPDTCSRLRANVVNLDVEIVEAALSDRTGHVDFVEGAVSHVFTAANHAQSYHLRQNTITVPCLRLDEFPISGDSIILKIDVEGQELEVLRGCEGLFRAGRIKVVYLDGYDSAEVVDFLSSWDFVFYDGRRLVPQDKPGFSLLAIKRPVAN
jgi:FkbM family methyltransferase